jgi:tRNA modification GTPase
LVPRRAAYGAFRDAAGAPIDHGLALYFAAPNSYTGEDVLELQAHGGAVVLQLLVARCLQLAAQTDPSTGRMRLPDLRLARPGEFTQRAYLNGKLDLAQAEAVSDLIDASTEAAARSAVRSLSGQFSTLVVALRDDLIALRVLVEATLDFPEEEIDFLDRADARGRLRAIAHRVDAVLARARQGALLRDGMTVVLAGQPNVGKSSLLNALAGSELAIVTPIPGTTRDAVTGAIQIEGVPVHIIDTAGLRESADEVEQLGVQRSWAHIARADAVLFLQDLTRLEEPAYAAGDAQIRARLPAALVDGGRLLEVYNKADLLPGRAPVEAGLTLSALRGDGIAELRQALLRLAGWQAQDEGVFIARARHIQALCATREHLLQAQALFDHAAQALDLLAHELRLAHEALGEITGAYSSDALLGEIFSRFCIGK